MTPTDEQIIAHIQAHPLNVVVRDIVAKDIGLTAPKWASIDAGKPTPRNHQ